jgi:hypothetical protein
VCWQVLATNRLDGRAYAIKKIRMSAQNPQLNHKILREVATLSRLQHTHVVRYFQVCKHSIPACMTCDMSVHVEGVWGLVRHAVCRVVRSTLSIVYHTAQRVISLPRGSTWCLVSSKQGLVARCGMALCGRHGARWAGA